MGRYIDADELLKRLNSCKYSAEKTTMRQVTYNAAISDACRSVDAIPTADVAEVKHGKWIVQDKGIIVTSYRCSECGRVVRDDTGYDVTVDYPYCHCGAKMVTEDEE